MQRLHFNVAAERGGANFSFSIQRWVDYSIIMIHSLIKSLMYEANLKCNKYLQLSDKSSAVKNMIFLS